VEAELREHVIDVHVDGAHGEVQALGGLPVGQAPRH
jgi:hypothetical protein